MKRVALRDGWNCHYCGAQLVPRGDEKSLCVPGGKHGPGHLWSAPTGYRWPTVDHVVPQSRGGKSESRNLVLACQPCNKKKGNNSYISFVRTLEWGIGA